LSPSAPEHGGLDNKIIFSRQVPALLRVGHDLCEEGREEFLKVARVGFANAETRNNFDKEYYKILLTHFTLTCRLNRLQKIQVEPVTCTDGMVVESWEDMQRQAIEMVCDRLLPPNPGAPPSRPQPPREPRKIPRVAPTQEVDRTSLQNHAWPPIQRAATIARRAVVRIVPLQPWPQPKSEIDQHNANWGIRRLVGSTPLQPCPQSKSKIDQHPNLHPKQEERGKIRQEECEEELESFAH
jgi:hypothetical protein